MATINNNYSKSKACIELVELRKSSPKAKISEAQFSSIAAKYNLSVSSLKNAWQNFNLYGKPSLAYSCAGMKAASPSHKKVMSEYSKGFKTSTNKAYDAEKISKILKEYIFGEYRSMMDFSNEYDISPSCIYAQFKELDKTGKIKIGRKTKTVLTFDSENGHGKLFPVREAVRYQRYKNKIAKKGLSRSKDIYANEDPIKIAMYENILHVLKEWL